MPTWIGGKKSFICNPDENEEFEKFIFKKLLNNGTRTYRDRIFLVTGKDTDNRFKIVGTLNRL
jgi:hypothetical protein